ncbi:MAG: isoleucine--tRNA ligase [Patescibacteria group bacterium]|nr:isoleucine--tRNA ligase [Patescibacteria group bacterium]
MQNTPSQPSANPVNPNQSFIDMEHKWLVHWYKTGIIGKYLYKNDASKEVFSFMDGPITANNPMGVHHAWGRSYKDMFQKFNNLLGKRQRFQNGFDCQGLWVEVEVEKELGLKNKKDIENLIPGDKKASIAKFVQLCKERVHKFSKIQTEQSKRLGYFMDWDNSYFTMSDANNYMIWHFLKKCADFGWIYKGRDSVPWCPRCGTAISQHEMLTEDYAEVVHETVFFKLRIIEAPEGKTTDFRTGRQVYFLAWTTTPWTLPGNVVLAVNPRIQYVLVHAKKADTLLIMAESRVKDTIKEEFQIITQMLGSELIGYRYEAPFDTLERVRNARKENPASFHTVLSGSDLVSESEGTGILHVAPGQGKEDFELGRKENLPIIELIEEDASYYTGMGAFTGLNAKERPGVIFNHLKTYREGEFFYKTTSYKHRYPRCWRCKTELVWRVVDEWYIGMDIKPVSGDDRRTLRERMIKVAKKINWIPSFGLDRELDWLTNMHDWLISKKRFWGLSLPIWVTEDGSEFEVIGSKEELKARAVEGWEQFEGNSPHRPYTDSIVIKSKQSGKKMYRIPDVGNPWLDAGIVPYSTITDPETGELSYIKNQDYFWQWFPVDFITESFPGQFKNWFYAMIAMSTVLEDINPYKTVLGFATLKGEDGRAMHKSWGNSIEFNEGADTIGVDVMRWMYARQNPADDMLFGYRKGDEVRRQVYLPLWNVYKFCIDYAALDGIKLQSLSRDIADVTSTNVLDIWILARLTQVIENNKRYLEAYNPRDMAVGTEKFIEDLSTWYLRRSRDRVWTSARSEEDKHAFYSTLYAVLVNLAIILSPVMPFLTEEIYTALTGEESVHLANWPVLPKSRTDEDIIADMQLIREVVEVGHRVRKEKKLKVRQPLASATFTLPADRQLKLRKYSQAYRELIRAELNIKQDIPGPDGEAGSEIEVSYDTRLTDELVKEGKVRELIRSIQGERKKLGLKQNQTISLTIPNEFKGFEKMIATAVNAKEITLGKELQVA